MLWPRTFAVNRSFRESVLVMGTHILSVVRFLRDSLILQSSDNLCNHPRVQFNAARARTSVPALNDSLRFACLSMRFEDSIPITSPTLVAWTSPSYSYHSQKGAGHETSPTHLMICNMFATTSQFYPLRGVGGGFEQNTF